MLSNAKEGAANAGMKLRKQINQTGRERPKGANPQPAPQAPLPGRPVPAGTLEVMECPEVCDLFESDQHQRDPRQNELHSFHPYL